MTGAGVRVLPLAAAAALTLWLVPQAVPPADAQAPAFAELGADAVGTAAPVVVGGRAVAVLYADNRGASAHGQPLRHDWSDVIEILARHAARCLEALTVQRTTAAPPPRFWVPPPGQGTGGSVSRAGADPGASTA